MTHKSITMHEHDKFYISPDGKSHVRIISNLLPTDGNNCSYVFTYDGNSNLTKIEATLDGIVYKKNLGYDGNSNLTSVSAWVKV